MAGTSCSTLQARRVPDRWDPWNVLEVTPTDELRRVQSRFRALVRISHPDAMVSRGVPADLIALAHQRIVDLSRAFEEIRARHRKTAVQT